MNMFHHSLYTPHQFEIALSHNQSGQSLQHQQTKIFNTNKTFLHNGNCLCFFGCLLIIIYFISYKIYKTFSHSTFPDHFSELAILVYIFQMNFKFRPIRNFFLDQGTLYLMQGLNQFVSGMHAILRGMDSGSAVKHSIGQNMSALNCSLNSSIYQ